MIRVPHPAICLKALLIGLPLVASAGATADNMPYVVHGNEHIIIGITLDETAVRAALPVGLEPAEGMTGGLNVYNSDGSADFAAYERSYVWVDLEGFDSLTGSKGRYILWVADSTHSEKLGQIGFEAEVGRTELTEDGKTMTGATMLDGTEVMKVAVELGDDACNEAAGTLNYPSMPAGGKNMVVTQFAWSGNVCGGTPVSVEFSAPDGHPLAAYKPKSLDWGVFIRDLAFAASPRLPIEMPASQ